LYTDTTRKEQEDGKQHNQRARSQRPRKYPSQEAEVGFSLGDGDGKYEGRGGDWEGKLEGNGGPVGRAQT